MFLQEAARSKSNDYPFCAPGIEPVRDGGGRGTRSISSQTQRDPSTSSQRGRSPWKQKNGEWTERKSSHTFSGFLFMTEIILFIFQALKEKELGNAAYKNKDFEMALKHYDQALKHDPTNMTYISNQAGLYSHM